MSDHDPWDEFMRQQPVSPVTYRRRRLAVLLAVCAVAVIVSFIHDGNIKNDPPPANSPDIMEQSHGR